MLENAINTALPVVDPYVKFLMIRTIAKDLLRLALLLVIIGLWIWARYTD